MPFWPVAVMTVLMILICVLIPLAVRRVLVRDGSIVERIRAVE